MGEFDMRKTMMMAAATMAAIGTGMPAMAQDAAAAPLNCPLRDVPYSLDTPLLDILLDPAAKDVVAGVARGVGCGFRHRNSLKAHIVWNAQLISVRASAGRERIRSLLQTAVGARWIGRRATSRVGCF